MALTIDPAYAAEVRDLLGNRYILGTPSATNLDDFPRYPRSSKSPRTTLAAPLSWLQAGYTQEEINVYGIGPGDEEVVVVHKVQQVFFMTQPV